jgi:hypothetical protein
MSFQGVTWPLLCEKQESSGESFFVDEAINDDRRHEWVDLERKRKWVLRKG